MWFFVIFVQMNRKLQQLKAPKKKQLQATKLSVEGRGMVKYLWRGQPLIYLNPCLDIR